MPNGESRNWIRLQITLKGFRSQYGHWPTVITVEPHLIEELQDKLTPADFQKLRAKLQLIPDTDKPFVCQDTMGNTFTYDQSLNSKNKNEHDPIEWLSITPPEYYD